MTVYPLSVTGIVTLSNGQTAEFTITAQGAHESGDLYGALLPAGPLLGDLAKAIHSHLTEEVTA